MESQSPDSNDFTFELSIRLKLKDYKAKLGLKKAWIIALIVALIQVGVKLWLHRQ